MIFKLIIVVAMIVLLLALILSCLAAGQKAGRAAARREQDFIDADTYHRLGNFVRSVLAPPADVDEFVVLPDRLRQEAEQLIEKIGAAPRFVRRK